MRTYRSGGDELAQNWDKSHVDRNSSAAPPRHAHTASCRRFADRTTPSPKQQGLDKSSRTHSSPRSSSVCHSRAASILPHRPCPTISASSSPALTKEPCAFQRGDVLRCGVKHARCSSKQSRIVTWSTPTFCVASWVPSFRVCPLFLYRAFTSVRYSTRKNSTSPSPSCRK